MTLHNPLTQDERWATDYDIFDPDYVADPYPIWADLRESCPIAHSDQYGGSWLPTRYADVTAIARDIDHFSSRGVAVVPPPPAEQGQGGILSAGVPPITADPPVHTWSCRLLLTRFAPWPGRRARAVHSGAVP